MLEIFDIHLFIYVQTNVNLDSCVAIHKYDVAILTIFFQAILWPKGRLEMEATFNL